LAKVKKAVVAGVVDPCLGSYDQPRVNDPGYITQN
jgi:hypothetical protein